jgi:hypothetical protein
VPFVADNSVVIGWFSRNQATSYTDRLYKRLARDEVIVPSVWPYEFANALAVLERRRILAAPLVDEIVAQATRLVVRVDAPHPHRRCSSRSLAGTDYPLTTPPTSNWRSGWELRSLPRIRRSPARQVQPACWPPDNSARPRRPRGEPRYWQ